MFAANEVLGRFHRHGGIAAIGAGTDGLAEFLVQRRAKHVGTDIVAALKQIVGGELQGYSSLIAGAREQAIDRMLKEARDLGADAVVMVRLETSAITRGASELVAYGTAVRLG